MSYNKSVEDIHLSLAACDTILDFSSRYFSRLALKQFVPTSCSPIDHDSRQALALSANIPVYGSILTEINKNELAKSARVVVVYSLRVAKCL